MKDLPAIARECVEWGHQNGFGWIGKEALLKYTLHALETAVGESRADVACLDRKCGGCLECLLSQARSIADDATAEIDQLKSQLEQARKAWGEAATFVAGARFNLCGDNWPMGARALAEDENALRINCTNAIIQLGYAMTAIDTARQAGVKEGE